jgi:hypothetical protein
MTWFIANCLYYKRQYIKEMSSFPLSDFLRKDNAALVHLLAVVVATQAGGDEGLLATRQLCRLAFGSRSHGLAVIKRAHKEGYLWRSEGSSNKTGGNWRGGGKIRVNKVTQKGLMLLEELGILKPA